MVDNIYCFVIDVWYSTCESVNPAPRLLCGRVYEVWGYSTPFHCRYNTAVRTVESYSSVWYKGERLGLNGCGFTSISCRWCRHLHRKVDPDPVQLVLQICNPNLGSGSNISLCEVLLSLATFSVIRP